MLRFFDFKVLELQSCELSQKKLLKRYSFPKKTIAEKYFVKQNYKLQLLLNCTKAYDYFFTVIMLKLNELIHGLLNMC